MWGKWSTFEWYTTFSITMLSIYFYRMKVKHSFLVWLRLILKNEMPHVNGSFCPIAIIYEYPWFYQGNVCTLWVRKSYTRKTFEFDTEKNHITSWKFHRHYFNMSMFNSIKIDIIGSLRLMIKFPARCVVASKIPLFCSPQSFTIWWNQVLPLILI